MLRDEKQPLVDLTDGWRREAASRLSRTPSDDGAAAIQSCAAELEAKIAEIEQRTETLTPEQFAEAHGLRTPQTVTRWCREGLIIAERGPNGWRIPVDAKPPILRGAHRTG